MADKEPVMNEDLADSIAMLEQILEVMPQDGDALKALYRANLQVGDHEKAFEYLSQLVDVAVGNAEPDVMEFVGQELPHFEEEKPAEVAAQIARLRTMGERAEAAREESEPQKSSSSSVKRSSTKGDADIGEELALAWRLYEENQLSQEEYSSVLHDLTEISAKEVDVPVSVLHVLDDRGFTQLARIMNYMSNRSGVPCISLKPFEIPEELHALLPPEIPAHDGALPFAFFGEDLLVAVLNPFDHVLIDKVERFAGHRCHAYLVEPPDYDEALQKIRAKAAAA